MSRPHPDDTQADRHARDRLADALDAARHGEYQRFAGMVDRAVAAREAAVLGLSHDAYDDEDGAW